MKFLCLICLSTEPSPEDAAGQRSSEYVEFTRAIRESGHFIGANRLLPSRTAITLRVRNGKLSTTDGPFAETKEQIGGYYLIEARDLNEAIRIAAQIPAARTGCIEVRPVAEDPLTREALRDVELESARSTKE